MKGFTHFVVFAMFALYAQGLIYEERAGKQNKVCKIYWEFTRKMAKALSIRENQKVVYFPKSRRYLAYSCQSIKEAFSSLNENHTIFDFKNKKLTVVYKNCKSMAKLESGTQREVDLNLKSTMWPHWTPLSLGCAYEKNVKDKCKKSVCIVTRTKEFAYPGKLDNSPCWKGRKRLSNSSLLLTSQYEHRSTATMRMHVYYLKSSKLIYWEYKGTLRIEDPFLVMLLKICAAFVILSSVDASAKKCWKFPWVKIYEHYMDRNLEKHLKSRIRNLTNGSRLHWNCMLSIKSGVLAEQFIVRTTEDNPPPVNPAWLLYAWRTDESDGKRVALREEGSVFIKVANSRSSVGCGRAKLRGWLVILCQARNRSRSVPLKNT